MKTLTVSLFVCAIMFLHRAAEGYTAPPPQTEGFYMARCPEGWTTSNFLCLLYIPEKKTWEEAETNCQSKYLATSGNLVPVLDTWTSDDIKKLLQSVGHKKGQVWVGGCDTRDPSWDPTTYGWTSENREHVCLRRTSGGNLSGCLKKARCGARLPSVCSLVMM